MAFKMTGWSAFTKTDPPRKDGANPNVDFGERAVNVRSKQEMFEKGLDKTIVKKSKGFFNKVKNTFEKGKSLVKKAIKSHKENKDKYLAGGGKF